MVGFWLYLNSSLFLCLDFTSNTTVRKPDLIYHGPILCYTYYSFKQHFNVGRLMLHKLLYPWKVLRNYRNTSCTTCCIMLISGLSVFVSKVTRHRRCDVKPDLFLNYLLVMKQTRVIRTSRKPTTTPAITAD